MRQVQAAVQPVERRLPKDLHALEELLRDGQVRRAPALSPPAPRGDSHRPSSARCGARRRPRARAAARDRRSARSRRNGAGPGGARFRDAGGRELRADRSRRLVRFRRPAASISIGSCGCARTIPCRRCARRRSRWKHALPLVALDLGDVSVLPPPKQPRGVIQLVRFEKKPPSPGASPWARLARRAEKHGGVLLLLARAAQAGTSRRRPSSWNAGARSGKGRRAPRAVPARRTCRLRGDPAQSGCRPPRRCRSHLPLGPK